MIIHKAIDHGSHADLIAGNQIFIDSGFDIDIDVEIDADVNLVVGGKKIAAHKAILKVRSEDFRA